MTPRSHRNGGIQSEWKPPLSVFGPHAKVSSSQGGGSDSCRLDILPHIRIPYIQVLCLFPSSTLGFYLVFFDSVAYQPRSTGHDLSLRQQRERERDHGMGGMAVLFCWCRNVQSSPSLLKGFKFLLLNTSAVFTKSLKQMPMAHQLPLVQPGVGFKRAACAKAKQKPSDFSVISPRRWSNGLAHAGRWWLWWCQSKRAQSGFGGVQSGGGLGVKRVEVKELVYNKKQSTLKGKVPSFKTNLIL